MLILDGIAEKLTPFQSEEGEEMLTITKGSQSRFVKQGLDYINTRLVPTDSVTIERVNEFSGVYKDRSKRVFTGSKWIIICSAGMGVLFAVTGGITVFLFIHFLGLLFYILSSRTTMYTLKASSPKRTGFLTSSMAGIYINFALQSKRQSSHPQA